MRRTLASISAALICGTACWSGLQVGLNNDLGAIRALFLEPKGTPPAGRIQHSAVFDPGSNRMIVFGGATASHPLSDTWILTNPDGLGGALRWVRVSASDARPQPRQGHSAVYDRDSNRMIVFGGQSSSGGAVFGDTWVLILANGEKGPSEWRAVLAAAGGPPARTRHTAVYSQEADRMIVFGGANLRGQSYNDVWVLTDASGTGGPSAWLSLEPQGERPPALQNHSAVYDPASGRMTVFGGLTAAGDPSNELWVLTGSTGLEGRPSWVRASPSGASPAARALHTAVYDRRSNRMSVFGGFNGSSAINDVWVLANANGLGGPPSWMWLSPIGSLPGQRGAHSAVYAESSNRMIVFGGFRSMGEEFADVWVLTGANGLPNQIAQTRM